MVPNKFPALGIEGDLNREGEGMFDRMNGVGAHEVIIETPDHQSTLATISERAIEDVLWAYRERVIDLKNDKRFRYVLIFKNHGDAAGASLEHSHSQLIALPIVPKRVREELDGAFHYYREKERCIYCDMIRQELESGVRVISENEHCIALAPYAPRFPFEMWVAARNNMARRLKIIESPVYASLAKMLKDIFVRIDSVLDHPAYNFMLHTSPVGEENNEYYHWHFEIIPKLTRSRRIRVGNRLLHLSYAARGIRTFPARGAGRRAADLIWMTSSLRLARWNRGYDTRSRALAYERQPHRERNRTQASS